MAEIYMDSKFLLKRGDEAKWEELNPILERGEPGFAVDIQRLKVGDGVHTWKELKYIGSDHIFLGKTHYDFPNVGREDVLYKASEEKALYQWNETEGRYENITVHTEIDATDISVIYGGNAQGI